VEEPRLRLLLRPYLHRDVNRLRVAVHRPCEGDDARACIPELPRWGAAAEREHRDSELLLLTRALAEVRPAAEDREAGTCRLDDVHSDEVPEPGRAVEGDFDVDLVRSDELRILRQLDACRWRGRCAREARKQQRDHAHQPEENQDTSEMTCGVLS